MVWGLFSADSLSGEEKYYIFSKGTYKVGRKGCDIVINKDKGVSRIHAEITVAAMTDTSPSAVESSASSAKIAIWFLLELVMQPTGFVLYHLYFMSSARNLTHHFVFLKKKYHQLVVW
ncbi:hypothetical protein NL676_031300 [Syzygium grande]|nr:hypothetical protein NL676_031300 [Syzygium grande]